MRVVVLPLAAVVATLAIAACGKSSDPPPPASPSTTSAPDVASGNTLTPFQERALLGHYSTPNGASGFILDRTQTPWRAKLDGTNKVVTMKLTNTPHQGEEEYTSEDKAIWIRVEVDSGEVLLFQGPKQHQGVSVLRDADADRL